MGQFRVGFGVDSHKTYLKLFGSFLWPMCVIIRKQRLFCIGDTFTQLMVRIFVNTANAALVLVPLYNNNILSKFWTGACKVSVILGQLTFCKLSQHYVLNMCLRTATQNPMVHDLTSTLNLTNSDLLLKAFLRAMFLDCLSDEWYLTLSFILHWWQAQHNGEEDKLVTSHGSSLNLTKHILRWLSITVV